MSMDICSLAAPPLSAFPALRGRSLPRFHGDWVARNSFSPSLLRSGCFWIHSVANFFLKRASIVALHSASSGFGKVEEDFQRYQESSEGEEDEYVTDPQEDVLEEDANLGLLFEVAQKLFKRVSRRTTRAARGLLPPTISSQLVEFSCNGILLLGSLWILKSFLEIICNLGSAIFIGIVLIRGVWSILSYLHMSNEKDIGNVDGNISQGKSHYQWQESHLGT
eukprot:c19331_g2_i2 orf=100-765(+)